MCKREKYIQICLYKESLDRHIRNCQDLSTGKLATQRQEGAALISISLHLLKLEHLNIFFNPKILRVGRPKSRQITLLEEHFFYYSFF
jgi:hypothetical protein